MKGEEKSPAPAKIQITTFLFSRCALPLCYNHYQSKSLYSFPQVASSTDDSNLLLPKKFYRIDSQAQKSIAGTSNTRRRNDLGRAGADERGEHRVPLHRRLLPPHPDQRIDKRSRRGGKVGWVQLNELGAGAHVVRAWQWRNWAWFGFMLSSTLFSLE